MKFFDDATGFPLAAVLLWFGTSVGQQPAEKLRACVRGELRLCPCLPDLCALASAELARRRGLS